MFFAFYFLFTNNKSISPFFLQSTRKVPEVLFSSYKLITIGIPSASGMHQAEFRYVMNSLMSVSRNVHSVTHIQIWLTFQVSSVRTVRNILPALTNVANEIVFKLVEAGDRPSVYAVFRLHLDHTNNVIASRKDLRNSC